MMKDPASPSLFATLKTLLMGVGVGLMIRLILFSFLGFVLFVAFSFLAYSVWEPGHGFIMHLLVGTLIFLGYPIVGSAGGAIFAISKALKQVLAKGESGLNTLIGPIMAELADRLTQGKEGMPIEQFRPSLDEKIRQLAAEEESKQRGFVRGLLFRKGLEAFRWLLADDMVGTMWAQGDTHVNPRTLERYAREKMVALVREWIEDQIDLVRYAVYFIWALCLGLPIYGFLF